MFKRKITYCQFLAIDHSISSRTVSFPWWKKERDARTEFEICLDAFLIEQVEHGYPRNQVSKYPGAYILQMVRVWNMDLIADH